MARTPVGSRTLLLFGKRSNLYKVVKYGPYQDDLDLRIIANSGQLTEAQTKAARCLPFLRRVGRGDYLLYPHQPQRNAFVAVRVTGEYQYRLQAESIDGGFRSFRPCSLETPEPIDWNDDIVPVRLKRGMGLMQRLYEIQALDAVEDVLRRQLDVGRQVAPNNLKKGIKLVQAGATPLLMAFNTKVSALIHDEFRQQDFRSALP